MSHQILGDNSKGMSKSLKRVSITQSSLQIRNEKEENK
jgi:hypothetical protein